MEKVVTKRDLHDRSDVQADLEYWLSRPPEERVAAVDFLRRQFYGPPKRMERVVRVIRLSEK